METFERFSSDTPANRTHQLCFRCETHSEVLLKRLQGLQNLNDVVLIAGESGKRISAHRLILMASSDFFSDLLREPKDESKVWEITLNDVDGDALEKLINFCYTGSLELQVDTIKTLFSTANHLQLKDITEGCSEFFLRNLHPSNCLTVAFLAEELKLEEPLHNIKKFICEHFEEVSQQPEFLLLNAKQLSQFIASDDLDVPSEEFVFHVLMKWIEFEPENRRKHFTELLAQVRLSLLSTAFLTESVEPLCTTMESQVFLLNELKSRLLLTSNFTQPRKSLSKSVVNQLWVICAQKTTKKNENLAIAGYNLHTKLWTLWDTEITHLSDFAVTLMGEDLIVVGGSSNYSPINTVTKLNLHVMVSREMAPLRTSRSNHAVAVLKGAIYAIGGYNGHHALNSVERWEPEKNRTWEFVALMKNPRQHPAVAVINDRLYVSGGLCSGESVKSVEFYDPVENTWRSSAPMKVGRYSHCLAAHKGYLFAIGGFSIVRYDRGRPIYDLNIATERYDPFTDKWTSISCSPNIYGYTRYASLASQLFIYNGKKSKLFTIICEDSCDNLNLQILPTPSDTSISSSCKALVANP